LAITELFRQTVTLVRTTSEDRDAIGGSSPDGTTTTDVQGYLEPRSEPRQGSGEDLSDRGTLIGDWRLFLPEGTDITGWDRVTYLGHTFDVLGPPKPFDMPEETGIAHIEVELREVV
jgi:hypothetical protein